MVYFTEYSDSTKRCLIILKDENQSLDSGIILPVREGAFENITDSQILKDNFILLPKWSKEKIDIGSSNDKQLKNSLEHCAQSPWRILLSHYWEWLELAVARNTTILKRARLFDVVMASMYTYDCNSDIVRAFCEAWCPSTNTLHTSAGEMSISLWDLWVLGGLPIKVASLMAEGDTFSLAIPVLANIYSGLRQIHDCTSSLGHSNACFPIHYVHGWLALYFNTYYKAPTSLRGPRMVEFSGEGGAKYYTNLEARTHIHKEKYVSWHACLQAKNKDELLTDDGTLIHWNASFFISIRFCFLFSQYGSSTVIEPYSPCRFGRQFGFYQDVPYDLGKKIPKANLANVRYHWMICVRESTLSQVYLPAPTFHPCNHLTLHYKTWWLAKHAEIKKICSSKLEEQPVEKAKKGTKCLVATSTPSAQFKFAARSVANNVRKDLLILTTGKRPSTHTEDNHSSNDDHHWKRPKRPDKQSIDDEKPPIEVLDSSLGDHVLQIEGTSKPMASPENLSASENSKTPIGATAMSTCPLVTKASPQRVGGTTAEISHFCANNLISDLRRKNCHNFVGKLTTEDHSYPF
ncbi:uncharacterized protein E5676_scaffold654G00670 [Cucumis melo var. makuwa]|uniref:Aminotransferase-like plant mobile domain-containing protein n=1 Tax=Cucumis melo var. makuwa TaxID=1194695 RepID=A0A5D3C9B7_CUCMM|nr:uncharacterized protein E5676_scaffold654G00670 [Cucumis melo var. makuwa]